MYLKEIIQKTKKGPQRKYAQFVESVRTEKGPRQKVLVNLGRIDTQSGSKMLELLAIALVEIVERLHILDVAKDVTGKESKEMGCGLVFKKLDQQIGIKKILKNAFRNVKTDFNVEDALSNLILNRLSAPASKNATTEWQQNQHDINEYDTHQYYRAMDHLHDNQEEIEDQLFQNMKSLAKPASKDLSVALFDTTSVVYYGEGDKEESLLKHGFSKARRSDLKQIVVGLALTKDGVPISHEVFSGNTNDQSCFKEIIHKFSRKFAERHVTFVGDRGLINGRNIDLLIASGYSYILGFKMRSISKNERADIFAHKRWKPITKELEYRDINYKGQRLIVYYNKERATKDRLKREELIERIQEKIKNGTILSVVSNGDYKKFLKIEGKKPRLDLEKIKADALYDGIFILTTNTKLRAGDIVSRYRDLWQCESGFRTLKSELELQPLFHRKERRIKSHVFICFLALIFKSMLLKKMRVIDAEASYNKTIRELKKIHAMYIRIYKMHLVVRTEIHSNAKIAFRALGMAFPKKVLRQENSSTLILRSN